MTESMSRFVQNLPGGRGWRCQVAAEVVLRVCDRLLESGISEQDIREMVEDVFQVSRENALH